MKRKVLLVAVAMLSTLLCTSCDFLSRKSQEGNIITSTSSTSQGGNTITLGNLGHFDGVKVADGITLKYVAEGTPSITVTTSSIAPSDVMVRVDDDELKINYSNAIQVANEKTWSLSRAMLSKTLSSTMAV